jgi:hypothetical protein
VLAETPREKALLRRHGIETRFAPQNMFIEETMFQPLPKRTRSFDAVHNTQLAPLKRHDLARLAACWAYVTFFRGNYPHNVRRPRLSPSSDTCRRLIVCSIGSTATMSR